jgi:hypothetical protein
MPVPEQFPMQPYAPPPGRKGGQGLAIAALVLLGVGFLVVMVIALTAG